MRERSTLGATQWIVVLAALALALGLFIYGTSQPFELRAKGDARTYMVAALRLRTLPGIVEYSGARSIGMPLFDASVRAVILAVAEHAAWPRWLDVLSSVLLAIHLITTAVFVRLALIDGLLRSRWAAVAAFGLLASCPALIGHTTTPLTDTLAIDVVLLGVAALHIGWRHARVIQASMWLCVAGIAFAFAILLRPAFLAGATALLLTACIAQACTNMRGLHRPLLLLLACVGTLAPFALQCGRGQGVRVCLQPEETFDSVRHAQVGLRGGRVLWEDSAAPGDILPVLPDAFMVEHFYAPCRLSAIAGADPSSLSGCLLTHPLSTPVLLVKKWIALFDHFRFTPYLARRTPTWLRWLSRGYDLLLWLGFALLPVWVVTWWRGKPLAALREHVALFALSAFCLVMLIEHTALHTEDRFSLPLLPICGLSLVAYLERARPRVLAGGPRATWRIAIYAAVASGVFLVQAVVWDAHMQAILKQHPNAASQHLGRPSGPAVF